MGGYAWVTLATNDAYSLGALVLAHSLRRVGTKYELACLVTPGVTETMREKLAAVFSLVQEVNVLDSKDEANLALLARPELGITFTKLHCWRLTQYEKCVFVDADALVVQNCDELFEREELSAAPDVGWPDCFNSGVFVFRPSQQTFASITAFAAAKGSFDGGDQGLLNMYFSDWATKDISKHLPFIYNMCSTATYSYLPAFKQFGEDVRIIHFIGITKPWLQYFDSLTSTVQPPSGSTHLQPLLQLWWNIFCERVHPQLSPSMAGIAGALAQITLGEARSAEQIALEEHMRKQSWEQGQIDYMGRDSFDNIWKKICETLSSASQSQTTSPKEDTATPETAKETAIKEITDALADVKMDKPAVEADKDPTQSLICEISKEEKLSATQIEQSASSEKDNVAKAASMKVLSELSEDVCAKPVTELKDIKSQEIDADAPSPQPLIESLSVEQRESTSQTQEAVTQDENLKTKELPQADSQAPPLDCKLPSQETIADLQIDSTKSASTEAKMEAPTSVSQDVTQPAAPISLGSPQDANIASPAASETTAKETTKHVTEFTLDLSQPLTIDPGEQHADVLSAASEISTVSPVPIQVAESVLQAEPKESILGAASTMSDQAIATTVTAVHESTEVTSAPVPMEPVQMNGSACEVERCSGVKDAALVSGPPEKTNAPPEAIKESASDLVISKDAPSEVPPVIEETILTSSSTIALKTSAKESVEASKPAEEIIKAETVEEKSVEQEVTASTTEAEAAKLPSEVPESPIAEQSAPKEPIEAKPSNIPSTPTVIEATPPISPCVESTKEELETEEKKGLKKSDSTEADGESADKKGAKKAVKKVTKKPKKPEEAASSIAAEGATADSSQNKAKKAVKTAKKTSTKTLETDTSAPETPPPPTSASAVGVDAPVPPKRKTKSTNSKGSGKKSEAEE